MTKDNKIRSWKIPDNKTCRPYVCIRTKTIQSDDFMHCIQWMFFAYVQEEFEDTKGAIRIRISKTNRQHNGQKKKYNDLQNKHIKLKIE